MLKIENLTININLPAEWAEALKSMLGVVSVPSVDKPVTAAAVEALEQLGPSIKMTPGVYMQEIDCSPGDGLEKLADAVNEAAFLRKYSEPITEPGIVQPFDFNCERLDNLPIVTDYDQNRVAQPIEPTLPTLIPYYNADNPARHPVPPTKKQAGRFRVCPGCKLPRGFNSFGNGLGDKLDTCSHCRGTKRMPTTNPGQGWGRVCATCGDRKVHRWFKDIDGNYSEHCQTCRNGKPLGMIVDAAAAMLFDQPMLNVRAMSEGLPANLAYRSTVSENPGFTSAEKLVKEIIAERPAKKPHGRVMTSNLVPVTDKVKMLDGQVLDLSKRDQICTECKRNIDTAREPYVGGICINCTAPELREAARNHARRTMAHMLGKPKDEATEG